MFCAGEWLMTGPKVLVVDDDRDTLALYTTALKLSGFEVVSAENGVQALRVLDREAPDAVVTDLAMPGMDGVAFCRHLRASHAADQVPVVAVSGQATPSLACDARRAGCDEVLSKPCLPDQLVETVGRLLDATSGQPPAHRDSSARCDAPPPEVRLPEPPRVDGSQRQRGGRRRPALRRRSASGCPGRKQG